MLIFVVSCAVLLVGIALMIWGLYSWDGEAIGTVGCLLVAVAVQAVLVSGGIAMTVQIPKENDYEKAAYLRESLEYRLENKGENMVGNELLYKEIIEFNNDLRECKHYCDNPWLNWFYNDKIATLDYINLDGE